MFTYFLKYKPIICVLNAYRLYLPVVVPGKLLNFLNVFSKFLSVNFISEHEIAHFYKKEALGK